MTTRFRIYHLLFFLFLISFKNIAAQTKSDSLINKYARLSKAYLFSNKDSAITYLKHYLSLSTKEKDSFHIANSYKLHGIFNDIQSNIDLSLKYYDSSTVILKLLKHIEGEADVYSNKGYLYQRTGQYEKAINLFIKGLKIYDSLGNNLKVGRTNLNLANTYTRLDLYPKAKEKFYHAIKIFEEGGNNKELASCLIGIGAIYNQSGVYDSAIMVYERAIGLLDSTDIRGLSIVLNNIGNVFNSQHYYDKAIAYYKESLSLKEKNADTKGELSTIRNITDTYRKWGKVDLALSYAEKGYERAQLIDDISLLRDYSYELADLYKLVKSFEKSTQFYEKYISLNDSLMNIERAKALAEIEEKYEDEVNEKKIFQLELDKKESESQRNMIAFTSAILLIIIVFVLFSILRSKKTNKLLSLKNTQVQNALEDKDILLKEIHHRVKNNLQTISSLLNLQSRYVGDEAKAAVNEGKNRVKSMALIHQKLYQSDNLKGIMLPDYLQNLTKSLFESYNINPDKVKLTSKVEPINLDVDTAIPIGLIINELISNSLKYAFSENGGGELSISLKNKDGLLELVVADNGVGFPKDYEAEKSSSFGMRLIRALGEKLESTLNIQSDNGTQVIMTFKNYQLTI
jgi:two-component system, sensor histidine kinase PdtaS